MLYRKIQPYIESYLKSDSNKVLIIDGAWQIGPERVAPAPLVLDRIG